MKVLIFKNEFETALKVCDLVLEGKDFYTTGRTMIVVND